MWLMQTQVSADDFKNEKVEVVVTVFSTSSPPDQSHSLWLTGSGRKWQAVLSVLTSLLWTFVLPSLFMQPSFLLWTVLDCFCSGITMQWSVGGSSNRKFGQVKRHNVLVPRSTIECYSCFYFGTSCWFIICICLWSLWCLRRRWSTAHAQRIASSMSSSVVSVTWGSTHLTSSFGMVGPHLHLLLTLTYMLKIWQITTTTATITHKHGPSVNTRYMQYM